MKKENKRRDKMILEAYRTYFPSLEEACNKANYPIDEFLTRIKEDYEFQKKIELIRLKYFEIAENALIKIILDKDTTNNTKISASRTILQYKHAISKI